LKKESGYDAIKDTRKDVVNYLKEQGAKTDSSNTRKIIVHEKYMAGDYTLVEVQMENEHWIRGAEILQRSLQPCSRKVFKTIPQHIMRKIFTCDSINIELQEKRHGKAPNIKWCVSKRDDKQSLASKLRR
jgi:hypothetical protein